MSFQATPEFVGMIMLERREQAERQRIALVARQAARQNRKPHAGFLGALVRPFTPRPRTTVPVCQAC